MTNINLAYSTFVTGSQHTPGRFTTPFSSIPDPAALTLLNNIFMAGNPDLLTQHARADGLIKMLLNSPLKDRLYEIDPVTTYDIPLPGLPTHDYDWAGVSEQLDKITVSLPPDLREYSKSPSWHERMAATVLYIAQSLIAQGIN